MKPFDVVRVVRLDGDRFSGRTSDYLRLPIEDDIGAIVEELTNPRRAFEVECVDPKTGATAWLEALYPQELELVQSQP
jgi:hypothetical protein